MRFLAILVLVSAWAGSAVGHTLSDEHGLAEQLTHQFVDLHHLPNLWLAFVILLIGVQAFRSRTSPDE